MIIYPHTHTHARTQHPHIQRNGGQIKTTANSAKILVAGGADERWLVSSLTSMVSLG